MVFVILSSRHMERCFLHYLVILSICLPDQNVRFKIKILRKITVTLFFLKDRSEEKVPNFALDIVSTDGISSFKVGILIFMHNIWCVNSFFVYNHHQVILNSHMVRALKRTIEPSGGDLCWCVCDMIMMYSWVKITDFSLFLKKHHAILSIFLY